MRHYITLGNGRSIRIDSYTNAIKTAIANPEQTFEHGLSTWWPVEGKAIRAEFFQMVTDHCNRGLSISAKDKGQVINKAFKGGRIVHCKSCLDTFTRFNPNNDMEKFCPDCRQF